MTTVFIIIPWFTPAYRAGGPIRSIENLIINVKDNIQYRIFCSNKDVEGTLLDNIQSDCWVDFNSYTKIWYHSKGIPYFTIKKKIKEQQPDKLLIIGCFSFHYNILPLLFSKGASKILSTRGMLHPGALSQKKFKKNILLFLYKILGIKKNIIFHATNTSEKIHIENIFGLKSSICVAENFPTIIHRSIEHNKQPNHLKLLSVGLITPMKNVLLVLKALSRLNGIVEYHIVGAIKDTHYWNLCLEEIKNLPETVKVIIHGELPHQQVAMLLQQVQVLILPSKSENYGHAIMESFSAENPVITSHETPWNQLRENDAGINVDLNIESIRKAILYFISLNQSEFSIYSAGAKSFFNKMNDLDSINQQYLQLFQVNPKVFA